MIYNRNISNFPNNLTLSQFHKEIENESGITTALQGINTNGNDVEIVFENPLSSEEETLLNNLILNHVPGSVSISKLQFNLIPRKDSFNQTSWNRVAIYIYSKNLHNIFTNCKIVSYIDTGVTSYDVRLYDPNTHMVLASANFTNTIEQINDLGTILVQPNDNTKIEIQVRKTGGNKKQKIHIETVSLYFSQ